MGAGFVTETLTGFAVIIGVTGADTTCNVTTELVALP